MSDIICVTDRTLCHGDFLERIEQIAASSPDRIILREKDLSESEYYELAVKVIEICQRHNTELMLHTFWKIAIELDWKNIHLPLSVLRELSADIKKRFKCIGVSSHSIAEAEEAKRLGASYVTAGHIFSTDCKKDLPPRGLDFLSGVCKSVSIPVYAIGGVSSENIELVRKSGAAGACIMSRFMKCSDPVEFIKKLEKK